MNVLPIEDLTLRCQFISLGEFSVQVYQKLDNALRLPGFPSLRSVRIVYRAASDPQQVRETIEMILPSLGKRGIKPEITKIYDVVSLVDL